MKDIFLALGGNIGHVERRFKLALDLLWTMGFKVKKVSRLYRTRAFECEECARVFSNIVVCGEYVGEPEVLFEKMQKLEAAFGREYEHEKMRSRTLDLDILFWGASRIQTEKLIIPHPRIIERDFVLAPILDIQERKRYRNALKKIPKAKRTIISKKEFKYDQECYSR